MTIYDGNCQYDVQGGNQDPSTHAEIRQPATQTDDAAPKPSHGRDEPEGVECFPRIKLLALVGTASNGTLTWTLTQESDLESSADSATLI